MRISRSAIRYLFFTAVLTLASLAFALDGQIGIHDLSTIMMCGGKYYTFGTGGSSLVSDDGVSRRLTLHKGPNVVRGAVVNGGGATEFCARFIDRDDAPVGDFTVRLDGSVGKVLPHQP
jgi:hypothetical protein